MCLAKRVFDASEYARINPDYPWLIHPWTVADNNMFFIEAVGRGYKCVKQVDLNRFVPCVRRDNDIKYTLYQETIAVYEPGVEEHCGIYVFIRLEDAKKYYCDTKSEVIIEVMWKSLRLVGYNEYSYMSPTYVVNSIVPRKVMWSRKEYLKNLFGDNNNG